MGKTIEFTVEGEIKRPVEEVQSHFADYVYHSQHKVHRGVHFTVFHQDRRECHYQQQVNILGLPQSDKLVSKLNPDGTLTTEAVEGANKGFKIQFQFSPTQQGTYVRGQFIIPVTGFKSVMAPLFKLAAQKMGQRALMEDRTDLESGRYAKYLKGQRGA